MMADVVVVVVVFFFFDDEQRFLFSRVVGGSISAVFHFKWR
jgi:hypothetical protein